MPASYDGHDIRLKLAAQPAVPLSVIFNVEAGRIFLLSQQLSVSRPPARSADYDAAELSRAACSMGYRGAYARQEAAASPPVISPRCLMMAFALFIMPAR